MSILQNAAFVGALLWLLHRLWQVYQKPVRELVDVLGLDIPPVPDVSLAGISADSVLLYWKPPENHHVSLKHIIQVNGINVGEFSRWDASIQVTGLKPGHYYNIRAIAVNAANFSTPGPLIRLRTSLPPARSVDSASTLDDAQTSGGTFAAGGIEPAGFRATVSHTDGTTSMPSHAMAREHSGSQSHHHNKRMLSGRRNSPATNGVEHVAGQSSGIGGADEQDESEETIKQLTEKLDSLRHEYEDTEKQVDEEEEEFETSRTAMIKERDGLKQGLREKEEASFELKKQVRELDKLNRSTQSKKASKEKILHQKLAERQRMKDDMIRWDEEIVEMHKDTEEMHAEKIAVIDRKDKKVTDIRRAIQQSQVSIKSMEEDIRVRGIQIKSFERDRKMSDDDHGYMSHGLERVEKDQDQAWEMKLLALQSKYTNLWQTLQQAEASYQQAQERLAWWTAKRSRDSTQFAPILAFDFNPSAHPNRQRRSRQLNSRTSTISSPPGGYPLGSSAFNSTSSVSPTFSSTSTFFNMKNGMAVPPTMEYGGIPQADADVLTGGAPMSPTANALLPSNLFRDEDVPGPLLGARRGNGTFAGDLLSILGPSGGDSELHGPTSPVSSSSRSPSIFSSPRDSLQTVHNHQAGADPLLEMDRQPVNSPGTSFAPVAVDANPMAARRLASLFNFNRQWGKSTNDPPPLGTLKQGQSQSFPRNLEQGPLDPVGTRRRRGSYGNWANPMANFLTRHAAMSGDSEEGNGPLTSRPGVGRRSRLHMFGSKYDPLEPSSFLERPSSPRPSSTYSFENALPRPSTESQPFGWPVLDSIPHRSSPLGADWPATRGPWSQSQSRRQSLQHGSTSNLSLGSTPLDPEDYQSTLGKQMSPPAPIGTRPQSSQRPVTPKLNPAAPTFKTLFSRGDARRATRAEKNSDKAAEKLKDKVAEEGKDMEFEPLLEESSPTNPRLSKDAHSIATATSMAESHDSLDRSTSGTPSEAVTPAGPKETLIQRITRKSSSSKFTVPWGKDRGGLFSKKMGEPSGPGEIDEDASSEGQLGKSLDSVSSTPQQEKTNRGSISWSSIMRKAKKGDKATAEAGERSSETTDATDEDDA